jgi:ParB-like nuclease domain
MAFAPPAGRLPTIEWVPLHELKVDDSYQRSIETDASRKLIRTIAAEWNWDVLDVLKVSRRPDDQLYLVDGQHRRAAAEQRGDIPQLPCVIKRCGGPAEEARLFIAANRGRKRMSRLDDFRAALGAGDADAVAIDRAVRAAALSIARHEMIKALAPGEIASVGALRTLLRKHGEEKLADALRLLGEAFPDEVLASPGAFLAALIGLRDLDPDRLFEVLLAGTTTQWIDWAKIRGLSGYHQEVMLRDLIRHRFDAAARKAAA